MTHTRRFAAAVALFAAAALLAACAPAAPPPDTPSIAVASGGGLLGSTTLTLYEGDVFVSVSFDPPRGGTETRLSEAAPGAYARARATALAAIAATPPVAEGPGCLDFGFDGVRVTDADGVVAEIGAVCPDPAVAQVRTAVLAAMSGPPDAVADADTNSDAAQTSP